MRHYGSNDSKKKIKAFMTEKKIFLGSGPNRGQTPVEWGDLLFVHPSVNPSVCPSICLSIHTSPLWAIQPGLRPSQPGLKPEAWLAGWPDPRSGWPGFRPGWLGLRPGWMAQRGEQMGGQMENLHILQDLALYRGRCPASPHENQENLQSMTTLWKK